MNVNVREGWDIEMSNNCERCGRSFISKHDGDYVCIVCLAELELDEQYKIYAINCLENNTIPLTQDDWENEEELI